jgi:hypothetical protein
LQSGGTSYTITLPDKVYTSIADLITDINASFLSAYPAVNIIFSVNTGSVNYGYIMITTSSTGTFPTGIFVQSGLLANNILGFRANSDITTTTTRIASNNYQLSLDNYLNMYISNLPYSNCFNSSGVPCSFKIPLPTASNTVLFTGSNLNYDAFIAISPNNVIQQINVVFYDSLGFSVNSRGLNWSMTLALVG